MLNGQYPGEFGAILFGGNDFHYLMRMEIKPLGLTVEEPRSTKRIARLCSCYYLVTQYYFSQIHGVAKVVAFATIFMPKKKEKMNFQLEHN